jgi:hypothetical protein
VNAISTAETALTKVGQHEQKWCGKNNRRYAGRSDRELHNVCERANGTACAGRRIRAKGGSVFATASKQAGYFNHS